MVNPTDVFANLKLNLAPLYMNNDNKLLFVYGTLLQPGNEFSDYLSKNSKKISQGKFSGKLYDLGQYPGAVYLPGSGSFVHGTVVSINNIPEVLQRLDYYEGIGSANCEYKRDIIEIETNEGKLRCWVYLYILKEDGLALIPEGDYLKYKGLK